MKKRIQEEYDRLDPRYKPISAWGYLGYQILFAIPVIGWLFLIIFACSGKNFNRRSFARSYFCFLLIAVILCGLIVLILWAAGAFNYIVDLWETIKEAVMSIFGAQ
ncbi:MAG: hypothetical protein J1F65_03385 [Clostridiales bacterium]|nr:hypothetical protein [Clostridiales bacterium]